MTTETPMPELPFQTFKAFKASDLWMDPVYHISKLFDGFDSSDFPISSFLEWQVPTDAEIDELDQWSQDSASELRTLVMTKAGCEIGDIIMIFLEGTM